MMRLFFQGVHDAYNTPVSQKNRINLSRGVIIPPPTHPLPFLSNPRRQRFKKKKIIEPLRSQTHKLFANNIIDPEMVLGYFF